MDHNLGRRIRQHERVAAGMVAVLMSVQDVFDRLVADAFHLGQNLRPILLEFVVHQQDAFVGRQHGHVATGVVHDHPQMIGHLLDVSGCFGGCCACDQTRQNPAIAKTIPPTRTKVVF